jgi:glycosyltransferase 2 family protein
MKGWARLALRLAISAAALVLAIEVGGALAKHPELPWPIAGWLMLAFGLHVLIVALLSARLGWIMTLAGPAPKPPALWLVRVNWASLAVGQIALGTLSGDAVRVVALANAGTGWGQSMKLIIVDRLIGLAALVLLGVVALAFVLDPGAGLALLLLTLAVAGASLAAIRHVSRRSMRSATSARVAEIAAILWSLVCTPGGWACLGLALLAHVLSVAIFYATAKGFGLVPPMPETLVAVPAGLLSSVLPVSFGGWGVRELAIAASYQAMNVKFDTAVLASVLFGISNIAMNAPGLVTMWYGFKVDGPAENER